MSRTRPASLTCAGCGQSLTLDAASSVSADRHPALREAGAGQALRLTGVRDGALVVDHLSAGSPPLASYGLPRALLDETRGDAAWADLRAQLSAGPFVDAQRLWYGPN